VVFHRQYPCAKRINRSSVSHTKSQKKAFKSLTKNLINDIIITINEHFHFSGKGQNNKYHQNGIRPIFFRIMICLNILSIDPSIIYKKLVLDPLWHYDNELDNSYIWRG
jgi:hypothetical protein